MGFEVTVCSDPPPISSSQASSRYDTAKSSAHTVSRDRAEGGVAFRRAALGPSCLQRAGGILDETPTERTGPWSEITHPLQ